MASRPGWAYDVFLSFRGEDTRKNFTDHLYTALIQAGILTFRDDDELSRGEDLSSRLLKAIQESRISIVIFSKGYASSTWCLDELAKILECKNTTGQIVLPIFYDIAPSDVRKQTGSFAEAFKSHEECLKDAMKEKVQKWREALLEASNLAGWDLQSEANGHESKVIRKIVEEVLSKLNDKYLNVATHPVGIASQVKDMVELPSVGANDVRIVGIYGMPGVGKTTMAKAIFNQLCLRFEVSCCLLDINKRSKEPNGLVQLQNQLFCDTLKRKNYSIDSVDRGINLIKKRFCHKRVLVILDDLNQLEQAHALVGHRNWFGLGSRIFITTRDEHLLTQLEVDKKYQAERLNHEESLELFSWHAFKKPHPMEEYLELSKVLVDYVGGLPLALEVLGSYLSKRSISEWKSYIEKLREIPHHQIQRQLRTSFDTLDDDKLKDMFLDIACFFIGMDKEYVAKILDGRGFYSEIGISILIQRSLLTINDQNELRMHDLLRDMGREIIRQMSPNRPGKRSRLWFHEDVLDVLRKRMGTKAVEGLMLDVQASKDVVLSTKSLTKMRYLKLLQINAVNLTGSYEHLSKDLIWLCWHNCPLESLPPDFQLDSLVVLDIQFSQIREVWKDIRVLNKLKILNLSHCLCLAESPNFSGLSSLERLILEGCWSLVQVHESIGQLQRLVLLSLEGCTKLRNLPGSICDLKSLEILNITKCQRIMELPELLGNMEALTELLANGTAIEQLPSSIGNLKNLKKMLLQGIIRNIDSLAEYSSGMPQTLLQITFQGISQTSLQGISQTLSYPQSIEPFSYQRHSAKRFNSKSNERHSAKLFNSKSSFVPASFVGLSSLRRLDLSSHGLIEGAISIDLGSLSLLQDLDLSGNDFINLPAGIGHLSKVEKLNLNNCRRLLSISELPSSLKTLAAVDCVSMERMLIKTTTAPDLLLGGCEKLAEIRGLEIVENKPIIYMEHCNNLANDFKKSLLKMLSYGRLPEFVLPDTEVPDWFSHRVDGSSISFYLPAVSDIEIQGLIVWVVYTGSDMFPLAWADSPHTSATIRKKTNDSVLFYTPLYFPIKYPWDKDHSWVTYIPFSRLRCAIDPREELELSVKADNIDINVKRWGVHLILNKPDVMDSQGTVRPCTSPSSYENFEAGKRGDGNQEAGPSGDYWSK